jgi:hypothetical protein
MAMVAMLVLLGRAAGCVAAKTADGRTARTADRGKRRACECRARRRRTQQSWAKFGRAFAPIGIGRHMRQLGVNRVRPHPVPDAPDHMMDGMLGTKWQAGRNNAVRNQVARI